MNSHTVSASESTGWNSIDIWQKCGPGNTNPTFCSIHLETLLEKGNQNVYLDIARCYSTQWDTKSVHQLQWPRSILTIPHNKTIWLDFWLLGKDREQRNHAMGNLDKFPSEVAWLNLMPVIKDWYCLLLKSKIKAAPTTIKKGQENRTLCRETGFCLVSKCSIFHRSRDRVLLLMYINYVRTYYTNPITLLFCKFSYISED